MVKIYCKTLITVFLILESIDSYINVSIVDDSDDSGFIKSNYKIRVMRDKNKNDKPT